MNSLLNIICSKKVRYSFLLIFLLVVYIMISAISYVAAVSNNIQDSVFRLHVIANSDSVEDQNLKYIIRDELLEYMNDICKDVKSRNEAIRTVKEHIDDFYSIAKKTIEKNGFDYTVNIKIGNFEFPTKVYGDITLPAGYYDALKIEIGEAKGKNWWCVMFPPLCFVNVSSGIVPEDSKSILNDELSDEGYSIVSSNSPDIKLKFKIIELLQGTSILTAKK